MILRGGVEVGVGCVVGLRGDAECERGSGACLGRRGVRRCGGRMGQRGEGGQGCRWRGCLGWDGHGCCAADVPARTRWNVSAVTENSREGELGHTEVHQRSRFSSFQQD